MQNGAESTYAAPHINTHMERSDVECVSAYMYTYVRIRLSQLAGSPPGSPWSLVIGDLQLIHMFGRRPRNCARQTAAKSREAE
jgi:hypothetical protein